MSGIQTVPLYESESDNEKRRQLYSEDAAPSFVKTIPGNLVMPSVYEKYKEQIYNLAVRPDDIYVLTWAKNGTTWTQQMVWSIMNAESSEKKINIMAKVPFLEFGIILDHMEKKIPGATMEEIFAIIEAMPPPRIIKSHLPYFALPPNILDQCKVVTCLRNPKDTVVSFYHHEKMLKAHSYIGDFDSYFDMFMKDEVLYSQYWDYTLEAWKRRDHPNLCLLFFEDMKKDLEGCIRKVAKFLGKDVTDEQVKMLIENLTFKNMKQNASEMEQQMQRVASTQGGSDDRSFFRKGEVGDWKNYFTEEMNKRMDAAIDKHFKGTGLEFRYE